MFFSALRAGWFRRNAYAQSGLRVWAPLEASPRLELQRWAKGSKVETEKGDSIQSANGPCMCT